MESHWVHKRYWRGWESMPIKRQNTKHTQWYFWSFFSFCLMILMISPTSSWPLYRSSAYISQLLVLTFYGISLCVSVCICVCVLCLFLFAFILFWLVCFVLFWFVCFCFILFYWFGVLCVCVCVFSLTRKQTVKQLKLGATPGGQHSWKGEWAELYRVSHARGGDSL